MSVIGNSLHNRWKVAIWQISVPIFSIKTVVRWGILDLDIAIRTLSYYWCISPTCGSACCFHKSLPRRIGTYEVVIEGTIRSSHAHGWWSIEWGYHFQRSNDARRAWTTNVHRLLYGFSTWINNEPTLALFGLNAITETHDIKGWVLIGSKKRFLIVPKILNGDPYWYGKFSPVAINIELDGILPMLMWQSLSDYTELRWTDSCSAFCGWTTTIWIEKQDKVWFAWIKL